MEDEQIAEEKASASPTALAAPPPSADVRADAARVESSRFRDEAAIRKMADKPRDAEPQEMQDALEWFLADEDEEFEPVYTIEVNVSTDPKNQKWLEWRIKPIASQRIDALRRLFQIPLNRNQRRAGQVAELDASRFNAALVFESTVDPDLTVPLQQGKFADGAQLVMHRFRAKPLLVDQIAGQVLFYSGGDDEDVREAREVRAAGN